MPMNCPPCKLHSSMEVWDHEIPMNCPPH